MRVPYLVVPLRDHPSRRLLVEQDNREDLGSGLWGAAVRWTGCRQVAGRRCGAVKR
jgi:hypothetical protein